LAQTINCDPGLAEAIVFIGGRKKIVKKDLNHFALKLLSSHILVGHDSPYEVLAETIALTLKQDIHADTTFCRIKV